MDSNTMLYNDLLGSDQLVGQFLKVWYTIVDSLDKNYSEAQYVQVLPEANQKAI